MKNILWEILVPNEINGITVDKKCHNNWIRKVRKIAGGLTILESINGQWSYGENNAIVEEMIPVRIMCSFDDIKKISKITAQYYKQESIMYYIISNDCFIIKFR